MELPRTPARSRRILTPFVLTGTERERDKAGRLRYVTSGMGLVPAEAGVPAVKSVGELVTEDAGSDLEQGWAPRGVQCICFFGPCVC